MKLPEPNIVTPPAPTSNSAATPASDKIIQNNVAATTETTKAPATNSLNDALAKTKTDAMPSSNKVETLAPVENHTATQAPVDTPPMATKMNPVDLSTDTVDTSNMTQQELEQHLKAKFSSENQNLAPIVEDSNIGTESEIDEIDTSSDVSDPQTMIPLPAIPSASESIFSNFANRFNEILITYYYKVKLSIISFISSIFGLDW